ncbi:predicted protein, partial [Thalassiosira pseudonana CCMP1335]
MPTYADGLKGGWKKGDPRWLMNEMASPARLLFLNGTLMSISDSFREFHESLVQPAMFAHPFPKNVAIFGGGEGATLLEVLKHRSVEKATMIEIDATMVELCKEHLPEIAPSCYDDRRTELVIADAFQYILDKKAAYDVLIVDTKV